MKYETRAIYDVLSIETTETVRSSVKQRSAYDVCVLPSYLTQGLIIQILKHDTISR